MSIRQKLATIVGACLLLLLTGCAERVQPAPGSTMPATAASRPIGMNAEPGSGDVSLVTFQPQPTDPVAMRHAWARWEALKETNYDLTVRLLCRCLQRPALITHVRDGRVVQVALEARPRHEIDRQGWTMERLFQLLRQYDRTASSVQVSYTRMGVPQRIIIDSRKATVDDETYYRVVLIDR